MISMRPVPALEGPARLFYAAFGWCAMTLAMAGVLVPGLPTTVFVLLASYCFSKSSPRFARWLRQNRWFGPRVHDYITAGGLEPSAKRAALAAMWTSVLVSSGLLMVSVHGVAALLAIGLGAVGTLSILFGVRTVPGNKALAVGSYRLVTPLGSGGMGEVWLAKHRFLVRPAAVKLIRHDVSPGPAREQLVRRFEREAQVTAGLRSPHTVQLYDFGVNDSGSFYYVMEFLNGLDLHQIGTRFGPQPAERVIMLMRQVCRSLAEAHERGLVHGDIKPANVFVTRLGTESDYVKILDFGVVKDQSGRDATMLSNQGIVQGTPAFMPPEIVLGEDRIDGRADLYSLACTAYWALTTHTLFEATDPAQMLLQHVQTRPVPPSERSELAIPEQLEAIIMMCLEKDPAKRPSSALQLDSQLARVPCQTPWTNEQAQTWWEAHAPEVVKA